jgi:hypothetical protein
MAQPKMWEHYAALPINFALEPKTLEEIRAYRLHLQATQILATSTSEPTNQDRIIRNRLGWLADLEDKMISRQICDRLAA